MNAMNRRRRTALCPHTQLSTSSPNEPPPNGKHHPFPVPVPSPDPCLDAPALNDDDVYGYEYHDVTIVGPDGLPPPDPESLTDAQLIDLFTIEGTAVGAALLLRTGGLRGVVRMSDEDLQREGVDVARIRAAVELGTRYTSAGVAPGESLTSPAATQSALMARLRPLEHGVFAIPFLDNRHRIIAFETMFRGTIDGASVHPREVVKRSLELNAAALIAAHDHPSGVAEPSPSDRAITTKLRDALALVDVRLIDHFVIGDGEVVSFAERGLL